MRCRWACWTFVGLLPLAACDAPETLEDSEVILRSCLGPGGSGVVGLDSVDIGGTADVLGAAASVFSNGPISIYGSAVVDGDVSSATSVSVSATVTGAITDTADPISVPDYSADMAAAAASNDNASFSYISGNTLSVSGRPGSVSMPAGVYYLEDIRVNSRKALDPAGSVIIYLNGPATINGGASIGDLTIISLAPDRIRINGNSTSSMHIFAPYAEVQVNGTADFEGTILGREVNVSGTGQIITTDSVGDLWPIGCGASLPTLPGQPD
jgi:cytoskeletal protein CcmA (bactofilin family)